MERLPARTFEDLLVEEVRCYLLLAEDLGYGHASEVMTRLDEVARLLASYTTAVLTRKP